MTGHVDDPFLRGAHPVGVVTRRWTDGSRGRTLPVEIYYPAADAYAGQDLDPRTQDEFLPPGGFTGTQPKKQAAVRDAKERPGSHPVVLFAHGYAGDRRECGFLCTHLASHGFRVVSADHVGSTFTDVELHLARPDFDIYETAPQMIADRFADVPFMLAEAEKEFSTIIESAGVTGVSLGGWTSYIAPSCDDRVRVIVPLAPAGAEGPLSVNGPNIAGDALDWKWRSDVSVMTLAADRDAWLPLYGQLKMFEACPAKDKLLVVLKDADHEHFCDDLGTSHEALREFTRSLAEADQSPRRPPWAAVAAMMLPYSRLMQEAEMNRIVAGLTTLQMSRVLRRPATYGSLDAAALRRELQARNLSAYVLELS